MVAGRDASWGGWLPGSGRHPTNACVAAFQREMGRVERAGGPSGRGIGDSRVRGYADNVRYPQMGRKGAYVRG
jgi:hypothetical protein